MTTDNKQRREFLESVEIEEPLTLNEYQRISGAFAVFPGCDQPGSLEGLSYVGLGVAEEAGEVAGKIKKLLRGDDGEGSYVLIYGGRCWQTPMSAERQMAIAKELGDAQWYIAKAADLIGMSLEEIARLNIEKLTDRVQRNQIKGSGDER